MAREALLMATLLIGACVTSHGSDAGDAGDAGLTEAAVMDAAPDAPIDLGYPDWIDAGTCEEPVLGPPTLYLADAPDDGLEHTWIAQFPGSVYSEYGLRREMRCVLRRARELGIRYLSVFMAANGFAVSGTFDQALELSRDTRLFRITISHMVGISGV